MSFGFISSSAANGMRAGTDKRDPETTNDIGLHKVPNSWTAVAIQVTASGLPLSQ